jgi:hypothetical protein
MTTDMIMPMSMGARMSMPGMRHVLLIATPALLAP